MSANNQFALARYNEDGSLDTTFSSDGKVKSNFSSSTDEVVNAMAIDSKGRIVAAGYATVGGKQRFALARYKKDGSLDTSFSTSGKLTTDFTSSANEAATALAIDSNHRIVVGGFANIIGTGATPQFALARYNEDGSLDTSFSTDGMLVTDFTSYTSESISALAIDSQGRIVVAGYAGVPEGTGSSYKFALARYKDNGDLDNTFAGNGKLTTDFPADPVDGKKFAQANAIAIDSKGRIVVAGRSGSFGESFALARYKENGDLDSAFAGNGKLVTDFAGANITQSSVRSVTIDSKGRIVAAGYAVVNSGGFSGQFALARYHSDGSLDNTFASNGKLITDFTSTTSESVNAMSIDKKDRIVVAGSGYSGAAGGYEFVLARYKENGDLDSSFSHDGKLGTDFTSSLNEEANAIAIDSNSKILVAGRAAA